MSRVWLYRVKVQVDYRRNKITISGTSGHQETLRLVSRLESGNPQNGDFEDSSDEDSTDDSDDEFDEFDEELQGLPEENESVCAVEYEHYYGVQGSLQP